MKRLVIGLCLVLGLVARASAQDSAVSSKMMIAPSGYGVAPESQSYTYNLQDDGTARAWLRVDGVMMPKEGGAYAIQLPPGVKGEVLAWYRENGCPEYRGLVCFWPSTNMWREVETKLEDDQLTIVIPKRKVAEQDAYIGVGIGISYAVTDVTQKEWWGRRVVVETGKPDKYVNYLSVGVYLPDGVYARNKQVGPQGWGVMFSEMMNSGARDNAPSGAPKMMAQTMLDSAGSGHVSQYKNGLMPGESYRFSFMTSTSTWKLYYREIAIAVLWTLAIAMVLAILLRLIIGKKSVWWYLALMGLLMLLFVLVGGLWVTYHFNFGGGGGNYPGPLYSVTKESRGAVDGGVVQVAEPVSESVGENVDTAQ